MGTYLKAFAIALPIAIVIYTLLFRLVDMPNIPTAAGKWKNALKMGLISGFLAAPYFAFIHSGKHFNLSPRVENTLYIGYLVFVGIVVITVKCLRCYRKRKQGEGK
ncbi:MAG: hypothetical protein HY769_08860 [Candidatus Stahlbacteria bacterium]|nr:hypothetical protein [Candidatus Stahlbacteria bacterium]